MDVHQEMSHKNDASAALSHQYQANDNLVRLPIELTNSTGTYLHQLNEDCLLEIFSSNSLTPLDLCSLAETCKLFKRIIQRVFPKEFGIETIAKGRHILNWKGHEATYTNLLDIERILKNFGHRLSVLSFRWWSETLANSVAKYSRDATLKKLELHDTDSALGPKLHAIGNSCKELEELCLRQMYTQQKSLDFSDFSEMKSLTKLKKLDVKFSDKAVSLYIGLLCELKSLEIVKIDFVGYEDPLPQLFDALSQLPNLREFHLYFIGSSSTSTPWTHLASVRKLKVVALDSFISKHFVGIIKQVTNLEELVFIDLNRRYTLNEKRFFKMVEERRTVLILKSNFDFVNNCDDRQMVRLIKEIC